MKKPNPEHPIIKLSLSQWEEKKRLDDLTDEDKALQDAKDRLSKDHRQELATKIQAIINGLSLTEKQLKIFSTYVETGSYRETARQLDIQQSYTHKVVTKIQDSVKDALNTPTPVHK